jgi:regulator of replication initiation timing
MQKIVYAIHIILLLYIPCTSSETEEVKQHIQVLTRENKILRDENHKLYQETRRLYGDAIQFTKEIRKRLQ